MSIKLMAYPMAFLISPQETTKCTLEAAFDTSAKSKKNAEQKLKSIVVLTNLKSTELMWLMVDMNGQKLESYTFKMPSGLVTKWNVNGKYMSVELSYDGSAEELQTLGEEFFNELDEVSRKNVRLLNSSEYFYYNYETEFTEVSQIYSALKTQGAKEIFSTDNDSVVATVDNHSVKYHKIGGEKNYTLEVEQKITIMNIGVAEKGVTNISSGYTNLQIKTNIRPSELKKFLAEAKYELYKGNMQTPLENYNVTLNWVKKDGFYNAEFSGENQSAITREAEKVFENLNKAAKRDLRMINDTMTAIYTYKTNYTDKGILLNTLTEHGAEEITEDGDEISCSLYGMNMTYKKIDGSNGYTLEVTQVTDKTECEGVINDLNDEYGMNIQEMTYNKIKERLDRENMRLESETVMEDNSIVLTIEV
jgi:hypothetical protein